MAKDAVVISAPTEIARPTAAVYRFLFPMRIVVCFGLIFLIVRKASTNRIAAILAGTDVFWLLGATILYGMAQLLISMRWQRVLGALGITAKLRCLFEYYLIGMFFNHVLPGSIGGDSAKAVLLQRKCGRWAPALVSILIERLLGLIALVAIWMLAEIAMGGLPGSLKVLMGCAGLVSSGVCVWLALRSARAENGVDTGPSPQSNSRSAIRQLFATIRSVPLTTVELRQAFGLSVLVQCANVAVYLFLARALHLDMASSQVVLCYPPVTLASMLPISLGGAGLRESAASLVVARWGHEPAEGVTLALLWLVVVLCWSLVGGVLFLRRRSP